MQRQHENTLYSDNISVQIFDQERFGCAEGANERDYTFRKIRKNVAQRKGANKKKEKKKKRVSSRF